MMEVDDTGSVGATKMPGVTNIGSGALGASTLLHQHPNLALINCFGFAIYVFWVATWCCKFSTKLYKKYLYSNNSAFKTA